MAYCHLYYSTLGLGVIKKKKHTDGSLDPFRCPPRVDKLFLVEQVIEDYLEKQMGSQANLETA